MKKKEKQMIGILILVSIVIIAVIWFVTRQKTNNNEIVEGSKEQGEYTKVEENGTVVNISGKLNKDKEIEGFQITNIKFEEINGETILSARITNKTGTEQQTFIGKIIVLNREGNEIGRIPVRISTIQAEEVRDIEATITESYVNAYDFRLEK